MRNSVESNKAWFKIDGRWGHEYLLAAVLRQAVADHDWRWLSRHGVHIGTQIGINPACFRKQLERKAEMQ